MPTNGLEVKAAETTAVTKTLALQKQEQLEQKQKRQKLHQEKFNTISSVNQSASTQFHQVLAGGFSGCVTRFITQPCDVLKIRFQLQVEPFGVSTKSVAVSKYTSIYQACSLIYREEGFKAFWKGHNAGQIVSILYGVVQFWSYEQIVHRLAKKSFMKEHGHTRHFVGGAIAGCTAAFFTTPFDVIRTRLIAQDTGAGYRGTISAFPVLWRAEGIKGLYRGFLPSIIQTGPLVGANFMFYNGFNELLFKLLEPSSGHLPAWILLLNGGFAGLTSKFLVYPLDFVKKRLQIRGFERYRTTFGKNQPCMNMAQCAQMTLQKEGIKGFYKGMSPTLVKSGLTTALYFAIYDKFKDMLEGD